MGLSLGRSGNQGYQTGYLRSGAWFDRRRAWFTAVEARGQQVACLVCGSEQGLDLHHVDYDGVWQAGDGSWIAGENDEDLMLLCRGCHEDLHDELDRRRRDFWGWDRRRASAVLVAGLRRVRLGGGARAAGAGPDQQKRSRGRRR
ncbi:hypothetical protein [Kocuria soli]|uniref:hypothetical protein n=1 Tax=Kocuria soli TaxID=2485125 RepID=UPI000F4E4CFF|nr:hypothetical protein [Kocuria soli]